jgi:cohesin complex subunit SA-1/2
MSKRPRKAPIRKSTLPEETEGLYGMYDRHGESLHRLTRSSRRVC